MTIEYHSVYTFHSVAISEEIGIEECLNNKVFYFSGIGDIDNAGVSKSKAAFVSMLLDPKQQLDDSTDIILPKIPDYKGDSPERYMPELFYNDVFKPTIDRSEKLVDRESQLKYLKLQLSQVTMVGFCRGSVIITEITKLLGNKLEERGFSAEETQDLRNCLSTCLVGPRIHAALIDKKTPGFTFISDNDSATAYYNKDIHTRNESLPENRRFNIHPVMSHQSNGSNILVLSHDIENRTRFARKWMNGDETYKWEGDEECFIAQKRFFRDRVVKGGHSPLNYSNITGEFFGGEFVTFQSNPSALLIRESIERSIKAGAEATIENPRDSAALRDSLAKDFLTDTAKNTAAEVISASNAAYTAMTGR